MHQACRQFEAGFSILLLGLFPPVLARKAVASRTRLVQAFKQYFEAQGYRQAMKIIQDRYHTSRENGLSIEDIAHYETGAVVAPIVNTIPAAFWIIILIHNKPGLLEELREEIGSIMTPVLNATGIVCTIDIALLRSNCPLLNATLQETLRYRSTNISIREVMRETILENKWLLRKGSMIQMPAQIIHNDPSIWGSDVATFEPKRFLTKPTHVPKAALRAFGGGSSLCPGRHLVTDQILALVAMFVMRFEMIPLAGKWTVPTVHRTGITAAIMEPDTDVRVEISRRACFEGYRWSFQNSAAVK